MEATICDTSAFLYWRTPPLVRLLASEPEDSPLLRELLSPSEVRAFRQELAASSPLCVLASRADGGRAHPGIRAGAVAASATALSVALEPPVDLLVCHPSERSASALVRPRLCSTPTEPGGWRSVAPGVTAVSPLFSLQQIAARASLPRVVMLASELCGSFSVYVAPEPVRALLQRLIDEGRLPRISGWSPTLDRDGNLTELWSRPPLSTPERLEEFARCSLTARGRTRLLRAAELVVAGAASPFYVRAGMLLGLSRRLGGEGYGAFRHNQRVPLTQGARSLARRAFLVCDIYWDAVEGRRALDVEGQSRLAHAFDDAALSDADRATALDLVGVDVVNVTYGQLTSLARFDALSQLIAEKLGVPYRRRTSSETDAAMRLREELFADWATLPLT